MALALGEVIAHSSPSHVLSLALGHPDVKPDANYAVTPDVATYRFVGWITNFIHNRKDPDINMVRGYLTSTMGRSVKPARMETIRQRAIERNGKAPTAGFLSMSSDVLDIAGETRRGAGRIAYKLHSRSHRKPKYKNKDKKKNQDLRRLRAKVANFVTQMEVEDFVPPRRVLRLHPVFPSMANLGRGAQDACFTKMTIHVARGNPGLDRWCASWL